jgi:hypothetical protein
MKQIQVANSGCMKTRTYRAANQQVRPANRAPLGSMSYEMCFKRITSGYRTFLYDCSIHTNDVIKVIGGIEVRVVHRDTLFLAGAGINRA